MFFELEKIFNVDKSLVKDIFLAFINYNESIDEKRELLRSDLEKLKLFEDLISETKVNIEEK